MIAKDSRVLWITVHETEKQELERLIQDKPREERSVSKLVRQFIKQGIAQAARQHTRRFKGPAHGTRKRRGR